MTDQTDAGYDSLFARHDQSLSPDERAREESRRAIDSTVLRMARAAQTGVHQRRPFGPESAPLNWSDPPVRRLTLETGPSPETTPSP